jgi:hypothetical protein
MALQIAAITAAVASLSVSGLTVVDSNKIPLSTAGKPMLFPEPLDFVTEFEGVRMAQQAGTGTPWDFTYTLNYTFWYCPIGSGGALESYKPMLAMAFAIIDAMVAACDLNGAQDVHITMTDVGPIPDPSGNIGLGCKIHFAILEMVN